MPLPSSPIPPPQPADHEDVSWALSTAEANWKRGDHPDALKWLQRAAESASEAGLDARYLELAKAASDLAGRIESSPKLPSGAPPMEPRPSATVIAPMPVILPDRKSGAPLPARTSSPPARPSAAPRVGSASVPPKAPAKTSVNPPRASSPPRATTSVSPPRRADDKKPRPDKKPSPKLSALTRPLDPEDMTQISPPSAGPATEAHPPPAVTDSMIDGGELEPWPTQTSANQRREEQQPAPKPPKRNPAHDNAPTLITNPDDPVPMQALRVVLTRTPEGEVRIGLPGKNLTPMSVEALIVALDTTTDLASWLK